MKKLVVSIMVLLISLSMLSAVFAQVPYKDLVDDNAKYATPAETLADLKAGEWAVMNGFPDGTFKPEKNVTRAELAKMAVVLSGNDLTPFNDVELSHWASRFISKVYSENLMLGYEDGSFKPEKNSDYATLLKAIYIGLGYEVPDVDKMITNASKLGLLDGCDEFKIDDEITRGNMTIIMYNALTTKIYGQDKTLLEVEFPDYRCFKNATIDRYLYIGSDKVTFALVPEDGDDVEVMIENEDLTKLLPGMKVNVLAKTSGDEFIAKRITPATKMVYGFVDSYVPGEPNDYITVDGNVYILGEISWSSLPPRCYAIFDVEEDDDGSKWAGRNVFEILPRGGIYAETANIIKKNIEEDDLVIIDGVWGCREDIPLESIMTKIDLNNCSYYWLVTSPNNEEVVFDLVSDGTMSWSGEKVEVYYLLTDNGKEAIYLDEFEAYRGKNNDIQIDVESKLCVKRSENDYHNFPIIIYYNYLGIPMRIHFGDVKVETKHGHYYAVVSDGLYGADEHREGTTYQIDLVDQEGEEVIRLTTRNAYIDGDLENGDVYADEVPTYVWAKDDEDNPEDIATLIQLYDGLSEEEDEKYTDDKMITAVKEGAILQKKDSRWQLETTAGSVICASSTIPFFETTAQKNSNKVVTGFEVTVGTRSDYEDLEMPVGTLVAYQKADDGLLKAKYVFIAGQSQNARKDFGLIDEDSISYTEEVVSIDGQEYKLSDDSVGGAKGEDAVFFSTSKDGSKAKIVEVFDTCDLDDAYIRMPYEDEEEAEDADYIPTNKGDISLDDANADYKKHKKYDVYKVTVSEDPDTRKIVIDSVDKQSTQGHSGLANASRTYDRIIIREEYNVILVFTKFAKDDLTKEGYFVDGEVTPTGEPIVEPEIVSGYYAVTSNGLYDAKAAQEGTTYLIDLVDENGNESTYYTKVNPTIIGSVENGDVYENEIPTFVWVEFDEDNPEAIATIIKLYDSLSAEVEENFNSGYEIAGVVDDAVLQKIDYKWQLETTVGSVIFSSATTPFFEATPISYSGDIEGFDVSIATRSDYEECEIPNHTLVAYKDDNGVKKAKYVFMASEPIKAKKYFGLIDEDGISYTEKVVSIDGQEFVLSDDSVGGAHGEDAVLYSISMDGSEARIAEIFDTADLDNAYIRIPYEDEEEDADYIPTTSTNDISLDDSDADYKKHKEYGIYRITLSEDSGTRKIIIDSIDETATHGHTGLAKVSKEYDRIIFREDCNLILVFTPFDGDDVTEEGYFVDELVLNTSAPLSNGKGLNYSLVRYLAKDTTKLNGGYSDLSGDNAKYAEAAGFLKELGIINGYEDGTFKPEENVERASLAKVLVYLFGLDIFKYSDVPSTYWASGFIYDASDYNLMVGYADGTFLPENNSTYWDLFNAIFKMLNYEVPEDYMKTAEEIGLLEDCDEFELDDEITRGNAAIIMYNALNAKVQGTDLPLIDGAFPCIITTTANEYGKISPENPEVKRGESVTLKFTANTGYAVSKVIVDGKTLTARTSYTFNNVQESHTLEVVFAKKSTGGGGGGGGGASSSSSSSKTTSTPTPTIKVTPTPVTVPAETTTPTPAQSNTPSGSGTPRAADKFKDVSLGDWFEGPVNNVVEKGLFKGTEEDKFSPYEKMTRAMLVTVLYRMAGEPEVADVSTKFKDVVAGEYYEKPVAWASKNGIVNGKTETEFGTNDNVTREQLVTILYRYAKLVGRDVSIGETTYISSYADASSIEEYAVEAMRWAVGAGIVSGREDGTLAPKDFATRAEVATIVTRFDK